MPTTGYGKFSACRNNCRTPISVHYVVPELIINNIIFVIWSYLKVNSVEVKNHVTIFRNYFRSSASYAADPAFKSGTYLS
jgi:hypothetical protein